MKKVVQIFFLTVAVAVLAIPASAQQQSDQKSTTSPLVRLLESKGILTPQEAAMVSQASTPAETNQRLAKLLLSKGLISKDEYDQTVQAAPVASTASLTPTEAEAPANARVVPAVLRSGDADADRSVSSLMAKILPGGTEASTDVAFGTVEPSPKASPGGPEGKPPVIPAFAPVRVLPVGLMTRESVKPVISAGPIRIQPYGFFKMNVIEDSSNPFGGDAVLSGMLKGDIGPNPNPEFHISARSARFGSNFEWLDSNEKLVITGKVEADFEGNFNSSFTRSISSIRSNNLGIRIAYGRLDYHTTDHFGVFGEFGQDWTPFCSSTLPSSNESALLGVEFGSCWERDMQARFGFNYNFGGSRHFQFQPEFALVYPAVGNTTTASEINAAAIGERSGADSNRPEYQSRLALQFQLDQAPGVVPAQLIVSGMYGKAKLLVASSAVPAAFKADFPGGASTSFRTFGYSLEGQFPTRWMTLQAKWWAGEALRFYFVSNLFNSFNPTASFLAANPTGVVETAASTSEEGTAVAFGCTVALSGEGESCPAGNGLVLPQLPVRGVGGFLDLGLPLSRWFNADPKGRNAGWTLDLGYNIDQSKARDLRQNTGTLPGGVFTWAGSRYKNDWGHVTLNYKLNSWVLIGFEEGYYRTRALAASCAPACSATNPFGSPLVIGGQGVRSWHDLHEQISTVFFF